MDLEKIEHIKMEQENSIDLSSGSSDNNSINTRIKDLEKIDHIIKILSF